jgi:hypothetical protein
LIGEVEWPAATSQTRAIRQGQAPANRLPPVAGIFGQYSILIDLIFGLAATVPCRLQADSFPASKQAFIVLKNLQILRMGHVLM